MSNVVNPNVQSVLVKCSYIIIFIALLLVILLEQKNDWIFLYQKNISHIIQKKLIFSNIVQNDTTAAMTGTEFGMDSLASPSKW